MIASLGELITGYRAWELDGVKILQNSNIFEGYKRGRVYTVFQFNLV